MAPEHDPQRRGGSTLHRAVLATLFGLCLLFLGLVASPFLVSAVVPSPQIMQVRPVPLAANPGDPGNWDFSNPHPTLHPGDVLVAQFSVCYSDVFGGGQVLIDSDRRLVSSDHSVKAVLRHVTLPFAVGCHVTSSTIDVIPVVPDGEYRVEANTLAAAPYYSRKNAWDSVYFTLQSVP